MKLQPASEMAKVAEDNYEKFKQSILGSEEFEALKIGIEEAANEGQKVLFFNSSDSRTYEIFKSVLIEAGYGVNGVLLKPKVMQITW